MQLFRLKVGSILGAALQLGDVDRALRAGQITHSADVNGDGRICECDLLSILLTETNGAGRHRHAFRVYEDGDVFDSVDTDQDGFLGDDTEKAAMTEKLAKCVPVDKARMVMDAMGQLKDDDGKVSREEYLLFLSPDAYPQAPVQPLPSQASANPKLPPAASPGQPAPQQNLPRPYPVLPAVEVADPVLSAAQPGPVEARSSGEPQPAAPREAANQPQLFKLPPQPNQLNALRRPVFSQPAASIPQPFRPVPLLQPVRGHPGAFRPLNLKHFLQSQQGGMPPAVPANFGRPVMASQWLQQAQQPPQPIVSDSQSQDAKSDSHDQPQDSEEELQVI
nr:hypothetical protein BaRGS_021600 [Batillaria attramentaria]